MMKKPTCTECGRTLGANEIDVCDACAALLALIEDSERDTEEAVAVDESEDE